MVHWIKWGGGIDRCEVYSHVSDTGPSQNMRFSAVCSETGDDVEAQFAANVIVMVQDESFNSCDD